MQLLEFNVVPGAGEDARTIYINPLDISFIEVITPSSGDPSVNICFRNGTERMLSIDVDQVLKKVTTEFWKINYVAN